MVAVASPRYEVVCRLAGGGMADLYLARVVAMAGFERLVVIKRLAKSLAANPAAMQALFDEARIAATLSHANIVQVNDVEVVDGEVSIVMEFLHGHDVSHLLRRLHAANQMLPLDQAVAIAQGVCAGLHHAHERVGPDGQSLKIVHRDVSPHNVFVTYDGAVKLVDFGIARATTRRGHTEHGVIKGKPGYIAPEQLYGRPVDRRTDVWGTGVLLFEMTTGAPPFGDSPGIDKMVAVATLDPPSPASRIADYPPELEAIVMRAIARDPNQRYDTVEAMRLDLDAFARARRLDLSPFRLGALMERVFATQLNAWRSAQREGRSLAEHVAAFRESRPLQAIDLPDVAASDTFEEVPVDAPSVDARAPTVIPPDEVAPAPVRSRPRRWRLLAAIAISPLLVLAGIAFWSVLDSNKRPAAASTAPVGAPALDSVSKPAPVDPPTPAPVDPPKPVPVEPPTPAADPAVTRDAPPAIDPAVEMPEPAAHPTAKPTPTKRHPPPARPVTRPTAPAPHPPPTAPPPAPPAPQDPDPDAPLPR